jgi:hypothetical protein
LGSLETRLDMSPRLKSASREVQEHLRLRLRLEL